MQIELQDLSKQAILVALTQEPALGPKILQTLEILLQKSQLVSGQCLQKHIVSKLAILSSHIHALLLSECISKFELAETVKQACEALLNGPWTNSDCVLFELNCDLELVKDCLSSLQSIQSGDVLLDDDWNDNENEMEDVCEETLATRHANIDILIKLIKTLVLLYKEAMATCPVSNNGSLDSLVLVSHECVKVLDEISIDPFEMKLDWIPLDDLEYILPSLKATFRGLRDDVLAMTLEASDGKLAQLCASKMEDLFEQLTL